MSCRTTCTCQCQQSGCGCLERPKVFTPNRPTTPKPDTQPETKVTTP